MGILWKENWEETKRHFIDWWDRKGTVISIHGSPLTNLARPREDLADPGWPDSRTRFSDPGRQSRRSRYEASRTSFVADNLPFGYIDQGPGSLALYLGSPADFGSDSLWYKPCISDPETYGTLSLDVSNEWWQRAEQTGRLLKEESRDNYFVGLPDIIENIDVLASLRGSEELMMDMLLRPDWVKEKVWEINAAFFDVYDRLYEIVKLPDASSIFSAFCLWGPGKVAKVQCDASAMFGPDQFAEFVLPALTAQCEWLDRSMYHLDGTQAICHLDALCSIEALDAIEWTPQAGLPGGSNSRWHPLYRTILDAGKSLQIFAEKKELPALLDKIGAKGVYMFVYGVDTPDEYDDMMKLVEKYR